MLDRQAIVDKTFAPHAQTLTHEASWSYALATNDPNPRYESGAIAPPMFAVVLEMPALLAALRDPEVIIDPKRFLRLLHGEHDLRFHGRLIPGRVYETAVSIAKVSEKAGNEIIELKLLTTDKQSKAVVVETGSSMFIRGEKQDAGPSEAKAPRKEEPPRNYVLESDEQATRDQSQRYAAASGDHNPIHLDPEVAKKAGLPDIILHGLCSMAFCQKAIINRLANGEPERLKRLKVRFAKPVFNGQTLQVRAWEHDTAPWSRTIAFDARVDGGIVLKDGIAELTI